ncbi:MAG: TonB family protein [bacterium]|nr:TonB family protein [bacterium]MDI1335378.1 TonB family protein [Lacunisphaera sp.]
MLLKAHRSLPVGKVSPTNLPAPAVIRPTPPGAAALRSAQAKPAFHYHGVPRASRLYWMAAALVSIGLHAGLILGFNRHVVPPKVAPRKDEVIEMIAMPDLHEDEEKKVEELNDDEPAPPSVQVPTLQDVPLSLTESTFTQLIDPTVPTKIEGAGSVMAIPLNIQRGKPDVSGIKDLFNIADLDRKPEPIVQTPPVFPYELKQTTTEARVRVGFIVTSKGDVIMPYIISSTHPGFERSTLDAVSKWKFKPGQRGGRKVNTRVEQPIDFQVSEGD